MSFDGAIVPWNFAATAVARETVPSVARAKAVGPGVVVTPALVTDEMNVSPPLASTSTTECDHPAAPLPEATRSCRVQRPARSPWTKLGPERRATWRVYCCDAVFAVRVATSTALSAESVPDQ